MRDVESRMWAETYCARVKRYTLVTYVPTGAKSLSFYIFKGKILEIRMEEHLYSPDGDSISCFIHIYILHFHMYSIEPSRAVECLFSFLGWYQLQLGLLGLNSAFNSWKKWEKERDRRWKRRKMLSHFTCIMWWVFCSMYSLILLFDYTSTTDAHWLVVLEEPRSWAVDIGVGGRGDRGLTGSDWLGCGRRKYD